VVSVDGAAGTVTFTVVGLFGTADVCGYTQLRKYGTPKISKSATISTPKMIPITIPADESSVLLGGVLMIVVICVSKF